MDLYRNVAIVFYTVGALAGAIVLYFTWQIYRIKYNHAQLEEAIAHKQLEALTHEAQNKIAILQRTAELTTDISHSISQKLIDNPSWLDRFMDQTGVTYSASVYGKRIGHFYYEKERIAAEAISALESAINASPDRRFCLVVDSGTTMYPVFQQITKRLRDPSTRNTWRDRVCVVTNNIPGIQYLMKTAKAHPADEYSEVPVVCLLIPGRPLSVYGATTGPEAEVWLRQIHEILDRICGAGSPFHIVGFLTGNYIARHVYPSASRAAPQYFPVARGEGHVEIKRIMVEVCDEIFILSPLMKFSFATVDQLNTVNGFSIHRTDSQAQSNPRSVQYEEIAISYDKRVRYFSTRRPKGALFHIFGEELHTQLIQRGDPGMVSMPTFDVRYWAPEDNRHLELEKEIPHEHLRERYEQGNNIWDMTWVLDNITPAPSGPQARKSPQP